MYLTILKIAKIMMGWKFYANYFNIIHNLPISFTVSELTRGKKKTPIIFMYLFGLILIQQ